MLALILPSCWAVTLSKGTILAPSAVNVSYIMGENFTFDVVVIYNDSVQFDTKIFHIIPNPTGLHLNLTLIQATSGTFIFNTTTENISLPNISVSLENTNSSQLYSTIIYGNLTISSHILSNQTVTINLDNETPQLLLFTFSGFLNIIFYNELTELPMHDTNISLQIWSDPYSTYYYLTANNQSLDGLLNGEYEFRYYADSYPVRSYYVNVFDYVDESLRLWMIDNNHSSITLVTVSDTAGLGIANATVKAFRKFISTNVWEVVEMTKTDINGNGILHLQLYDVPYRFMTEKGGTVYQYSDPMKITGSVLFIKNTNLLGEGLASFWTAQNVARSLTYNNATTSWEFTWSDASNFLRWARLEVWQQGQFVSTTICNNTAYASSGTLLCNISSYISLPGQIYAQGSIDTNSTHSVWTIARASLPIFDVKYQVWGLMGSLFAFMLILSMAAMGKWNPVVSIILACIGLIVSVNIGWVPMAIEWLVGLIIIIGLGLFKLENV
jgi:hypothetical protein